MVASLFGPRDGHPEFYPFFSWSLFTYTSSSQSDTVIIVRGVEGRALETPELLFDVAHKLGAADINRISLAKLLDKFGRAALQGNTQVADHLHGVIEDTYLRAVPEISYDVAIVTYNPVERYKTGQIDEVVVISSHKKRPK